MTFRPPPRASREAPLAFAPEVAAALHEGQPVVALESTIITHGMPYPQNVETAHELEAEIRAAGAIPATIAIRNGEIRVGLKPGAVEALARETGVLKLSRADLAVALARKATGSTTVAATMICARLAGIEVFATGGIGGVHRGAEETFDVSADLAELGWTPVTVVASGAKAILDIEKTLEVLETNGVPVIGYRTDAFPAFWSRDSGLKAPLRMDAPEEVAAAHRMRARLGLPGGQLVANPIPGAEEIPPEALAPLIAQATGEAEREGVSGKAVTPFLLRRILELTDGDSLSANMALVRSNARAAAEIAGALARMD